MNPLTPIAQPLTMTSREIAQLVQSRHDNVRTAIERLAERGVIALPAMQEKPTAGRPSKEFIFTGEQGKRDSIIVVAQLSPEFTARLVDRWQELEAQAASGVLALPDFTNPAMAARAWAEQFEQREKLAIENQHISEQLAIAEPKAQALQRIALAEGSMCIQAAAKHLQVQPKFLFNWLQEHQWIYRRAGGTGWLGYQNRIQSGLLEHKITTVERSDGTEKVVEQCRVTPRGITRLAELMAQKQAA